MNTNEIARILNASKPQGADTKDTEVVLVFSGEMNVWENTVVNFANYLKKNAKPFTFSRADFLQKCGYSK